MKRLLLDENIDRHLARYFEPHGFSVSLAETAGLKGISNGRLLAAAEGRFDVLLTRDKNIPHQNNLTGRRLASRADLSNQWTTAKVFPALCPSSGRDPKEHQAWDS